MNDRFSFCLLCGSEKLMPLKKYQHAYLVKCKQCRFVFSVKIPIEQELATNYKNYPTEVKISEVTIKRYNELLDNFEKYRKNNNILDVGCGHGFFLETAKKRNWNVFGTEYRENVIQKCISKGITMEQGKLSEIKFSPNFFDVITSFEVIEHINNPIEEISMFNNLLRPGGIIYITTPNFNSLTRIILGNRWNVIEYPEHLCYYTPKTIDALLSTSKLLKKSIRTTGFSLSRFQMGIGTMNADTNDEQLRAITERNSMFNAIKKGINFFLNLFKIGDALKVLYLKL